MSEGGQGPGQVGEILPTGHCQMVCGAINLPDEGIGECGVLVLEHRLRPEDVDKGLSGGEFTDWKEFYQVLESVSRVWSFILPVW